MCGVCVGRGGVGGRLPPMFTETEGPLSALGDFGALWCGCYKHTLTIEHPP